eukprot:9308510-Lingulodinium_polyedra.AAC.1
MSGSTSGSDHTLPLTSQQRDTLCPHMEDAVQNKWIPNGVCVCGILSASGMQELPPHLTSVPRA